MKMFRHLTPGETIMRDTYAILIEIDDDFDPAGSMATGDDAADAEYVKRHESGELTAYGVSVVELNADANVIAERYRDGSCGPVRLASLWGCDVENDAADGLYYTLASIPDEYLRDIARDLLSEAGDDSEPWCNHDPAAVRSGRCECGAVRDSAGMWSATPIPDSYPVRPLADDEMPPGRTTCGTCGRSWDDDIVTSMTPAPSARCPFEAFHF